MMACQEQISSKNIEKHWWGMVEYIFSFLKKKNYSRLSLMGIQNQFEFVR
jgi:hypothetical protein